MRLSNHEAPSTFIINVMAAPFLNQFLKAIACRMTRRPGVGHQLVAGGITTHDHQTLRTARSWRDHSIV
ncbi:hypothetical protein ACNRC9_01255, partial [Ralstonia pseudosolanacearum]|uniref:hypothetical protein n=1 Tax=Ralstonia pseudosolanacearum TaxID=1310165 RepID=UPI003AAB3528